MASLSRIRSLSSLATLTALVGASVLLPACSGSSSNGSGPSGPAVDRVPGQTSFESAPPAGNTGSGASASAGGAGDSAAPPKAGGTETSASAPARQVEETDLYRLDGDRLYYLNAYRGLMVFDVSNVDQPRMIGRSPIFGSPVEMVVRNGLAVVVVADWYGKMDDGSPFHGSIVRGLDATDPANIKTTGEARLGGWVRDTRVVGDVLYAVSEDYGWSYGWGYGGGVAVADAPASGAGGGTAGGGATGPSVVVSSVSFAGGKIVQAGTKSFPGYSGIFNVTPSSILLAHDVTTGGGYGQSTGKSELQYIDISDPAGAIALRGTAQVNGSLQGWGADNGRWNLDFADGKTAHVLGCGGQYCGGVNSNYVLSTLDFSNADKPTLSSELAIPATGWSVAARFDGSRMYLSPSDYYYSGNPDGTQGTPFQIYDLTNAAAPKLAGQTTVNGSVWNFIPNGNRLFALGSDYAGNYSSSAVSLKYLDVTNPAAPSLIGSSTFGDGWAWTPAAGTFKAFTLDTTQGMVVLPFSGWSSKTGQYNNGVQLISFTPSSIQTAGAAHTHGWVERGIFVKGRIVSLSDLSLSVVDYSDKVNPKIVNEMTLARNVVSAQPSGGIIAELASDWWGNDATSSELRVLPIQNADETASGPEVTLKVDGVDARAFRNGNFAYIVTRVKQSVACGPYTGGGVGAPDKGGDGTGTTAQCFTFTPQVQVVDLTNGQVSPRGKVTIPADPNGSSYGWGWGWGGCYYYDWFDGADAVQIEGDAIAFRRWTPVYKPNGGGYTANQTLFLVDAKNPDAPSVSQTNITQLDDAWWGNMRAVGDKLYVTHYEWLSYWSDSNKQPTVKYYLDTIDISDRKHPKVGQRINVPGILVGASETDPSLLYTMDYRWFDGNAKDQLAVVKVQDGLAHLQSVTDLDGYAGTTFVRGNTAYLSTQRYPDYKAGTTTNQGPTMNLHQIDLGNPKHPVDRVASDQSGWGWLLGVEGDRAIVTSGWGNEGIDIYKLTVSAAPKFDQFVRTRGWWTESMARQDNKLFLSSGYWGVQTVNLQ